MAGGERTVKIKFTGESSGVAKAAAAAERAVKGFGDRVMSSVGNLGSKIMSSIGDGLMSGVKSLPAVAIGGAVAAVLGPVIGAAVSSAVLIGVGGGVLAAGISLAAKDPRVKKAAGELKNRFMDIDTTELEKRYEAAQERMTSASTAQSKKRAKAELDESKRALDEANDYNKKNFSLRDAAQPLVKPLLEALGTFQEAAGRIIPKVGGLFKLLAPVVKPLAEGLVSLVENALPGVEQAVKGSVPLFQILADKLPGIGKAIGSFFTSISENGDDTNQFWSDLLDFITGLIIVLGRIISKLASWYSNVRDFVSLAMQRFREFKVAVINDFGDILDGAAKALSWVPGLGPKLDGARRKFADFRKRANDELAAIKDREIRINVWSNVGSVVRNIGEQLASLPGASSGGRRASGGPVRAGSSYLVGERGPEILTMAGSSGRITPNRELTGGGDVFELHVDLGNAVKQVIRFEHRDLKRRASARGAYA